MYFIAFSVGTNASIPSTLVIAPQGNGDKAMTILGFILFLIVAAVCAGIGEMLVPGAVPGGFFASAVVGIIGAWIGTSLFGSLGPSVAGVPLIPAILGSAVFVLILALISRGRRAVV